MFERSEFGYGAKSSLGLSKRKNSLDFLFLFYQDYKPLIVKHLTTYNFIKKKEYKPLIVNTFDNLYYFKILKHPEFSIY